SSDLAVRFQQSQHVLGKEKLEQFSFTAAYLYIERVRQPQAGAGSRRFAGPDMSERSLRRGDPFNQDLHAPATFLLAAQACLDDPGVVEHKQIARPQQCRQLGEPAIM